MAKFLKWVEAGPDELLEDVAVRTLDSRLQPVMHYVPLAAKHPERDIEHVHQMRVWARRAKAAMSLYEELLPKRRRKWINAQLQAIRRAANDARDDDVFLQRLAGDAEHAAAARPLLDAVRHHRQEAQRPIVKLWKDLFELGRFPRRCAKLLRKVGLRGAAADAGPIAFRPWAENRIQPLLDAFFAAAEADLSDLGAMHRFRIAGKKLRYAIELLAPAFGESLRTQAYPALQDLQDRLGQINDLAAAQSCLKRWLEQAEGSQQTAYLQQMLDQEQQRLEAQRSECLAWWNARRKKELRHLLASQGLTAAHP
ncbi:MAG: CHAD domain-containing protein [Candidatus Anammoximicrobium sp.]|nr:CHAD domain-containing protein [Candidatus Anammoximicrobium sp.]